MRSTSLKIKNYKCFGDEVQGFDSIARINIIIGRNNSGKSSLLDLLEYVTNPHDIAEFSHKGRQPEIHWRSALSEAEIKKVLSPSTSGGKIGGNHWEFGKSWVGKDITVAIEPQNNNRFVSLEPPLPERAIEFNEKLARTKENPFRAMSFKRLSSERDLQPEDDGDVSVQENGNGGTNIIQRFINRASLPSDLVEVTLLKELNAIVSPDLHFTDIVVQQLENQKWEIYLEEDYKGRIALSKSGSGLKTILLVLVFVYLLPYFEKKSETTFLYGFEELENNLHPAMQRRLFLYLRQVAVDKGLYFFITTHSSVVIDLFNNDPVSQIVHVTHDGNVAKVNQTNAYLDNNGVLDDLDVRASDLLQSNGIIWVEGPSDRSYFNHWMKLISNGLLFESGHYQCVFYGGRLLSHLTADISDEEQTQLIKILTVNRNAIMLIDSDKKAAATRVNDTKKRIQSEFNKIDALCWITKGREVENYIPIEALSSYFNTKIKVHFDRYGAFSKHLDSLKKGAGKKFLSKKVLFAERIIPHIKYEHLESTLDLKSNLDRVYNQIRKWNGIS